MAIAFVVAVEVCFVEHQSSSIHFVVKAGMPGRNIAVDNNVLIRGQLFDENFRVLGDIAGFVRSIWRNPGRSLMA